MAAYRRWGDHEAATLSATRDLIIDRAWLTAGLAVLDLASGHGEPALAVAEAVGPDGHVTTTDQGAGLLGIAEERARQAALEPFLCNRYEIAAFTNAAVKLGITYLGLCCGAAPHYVRCMAEALGRTPPASRYSPDMSKHFAFGTDKRLAAHLRQQSAVL